MPFDMLEFETFLVLLSDDDAKVTTGMLRRRIQPLGFSGRS
jgi:hypothetical protein